jgi:hypothetical protein
MHIARRGLLSDRSWHKTTSERIALCGAQSPERLVAENLMQQYEIGERHLTFS